MKLSEGTTLQGGKYCIEKCLGQGGFGITYLAEWKQRKAKVAIKEFFIRELCYRDEQFSQMTVLSEGGRRTVEHFRKKFLREAETIFNLNHPNIIRIFDVFEENGTAYYVMEYHANGSLADKLKTMNGAPFSEAEALQYTKQIANALAYIHEQKMPAIENEEVKKRSLRHLDIKPGNIMLNNDGNAILIDFGLVKVYDEMGNPLSTASSTLNGFSPGFAPLEQMQGSSSSIFTPATDIYALGATLYNLIEGRVPPLAGDVLKMKGNLPFSDTTSEPVRKAITEAMRPIDEDRPQSIAEFLKLLEEEFPITTTEELSVSGQTQVRNENKEDISEADNVTEDTPSSTEENTTNEKSLGNTQEEITSKDSFSLWLKIIGTLVFALLMFFLIRPESCNRGSENTGEADSLLLDSATIIEETMVLAIPDSTQDSVSFVPITQEGKETKEDFYDVTLSVGTSLYAEEMYEAALEHFTKMLSDYPEKKKEISSWKEKCEKAMQTKVNKEETKPIKKESTRSLTGFINGHEYVDLGLSVKWATCNVGASKPSDYGSYFAWGEVKPKVSYTKNNSLYYNKDIGECIAGSNQYDAGRVNWGKTWRLPTGKELAELSKKCQWKWETIDGCNGFIVIGPNGNSLFLPASGEKGTAKSPLFLGECGYYWSADSYYVGNSDMWDCVWGAWGYTFSNNGFRSGSWSNRSGGRPVRPVSE